MMPETNHIPSPLVGEGKGGGDKPDVMVARARILRSNQTDVERQLWYWLRRKNFHSARFRRQAPIGRYIADFACYDPKLIIELDGGQHSLQRHYDKARDEWLLKQGFVVLRFWNNQVMDNLDTVLETICNQIIHLQNTPHPGLPPQGGKE